MDYSRSNQREDAQLAADMQMAYDLQAVEEQNQMMNQLAQGQLLSQQNQQAAPSRASATRSDYRQYPGNNGRNGQVPVVQGRSIPTRFRPSSTSSSGAQSAITSDGLHLQQNQSLIFVPAEINDRLVELMVDTGAQSSVISSQLMRTLGLESKLNTRMQGVARGVGQARILGVIEKCPVQIGHVEFLLYFLVLDVPQDMIIMGIDQMRRFKCQIDLENDKLIFGGKDGVEVSFLLPEPQWANARAMPDSCVIS